MSAIAYIEPWMRGPVEGVHPLTACAIYPLRQAREDLEKWTDGLSAQQLWKSVQGLAPVGFHIRHIAGSTDRLITYLQNGALSEKQWDRLKTEEDWNNGSDRAAMLTEVDEVFQRAEAVIRAFDPATLTDARAIGRRKLPATAAGLLHHIGEHIMRHVGEMIITAKLARHS
ncbi:MAG: DinB family protein [Bryobacterales bacterium]|nr:DinB family protein [Bryobacterales bacterium]